MSKGSGRSAEGGGKDSMGICLVGGNQNHLVPDSLLPSQG